MHKEKSGFHYLVKIRQKVTIQGEIPFVFSGDLHFIEESQDSELKRSFNEL